MANSLRKIKKNLLNLSVNQKVIIILTTFLVLLGFIQLIQNAYFENMANRGDIKIFIDKYKGDSWNVKAQRRESVNKASIRVTNSGTGPVVLTSVACMLPSIAQATLFGTSEQKLNQSESILYEIGEAGDKLQFCEVRDSLGNVYQEWDTDYRNKLCWRWNETLGSFVEFLHKLKGVEKSRAVIWPLNLLYCKN